MKRSLIISSLIMVLAAIPGGQFALADTLELTDGRVLKGRIADETPSHTMFETSSGGITLIQRVPRNQIRSMHRDRREGPGYCRVPFVGTVGGDITADAFEQAIAEARRQGAEYVIIVFDSPGGDVAEMDRLLHVMREARGIQFVAYVKRALSAAAVLAIACSHIYMAPEATIGAAVPFKLGPDGTPQAVEEKFRSAIRASFRAAGRAGSHSDLWLRGMSEPDLELAVIEVDGKPKLLDTAMGGTGAIIKQKGQILSLTAQEAQKWGLSNGTVGPLPAIGRRLGLKVWHDVGDGPWSAMVNRAQTTRLQAQIEAERAARIRARNAYIDLIRPEVMDIDNRIANAIARATAANKAVAKLHSQYEAEASSIRAEPKRARMAALRQQYEPAIVEYEAARDAAVQEFQTLRERRNLLIAGIPAID